MMGCIKNAIKETTKTIFNWIKSNTYSSLLLIMLIIIIFFSFKRGVPEYKNIIETLKISVTVLISMLGFSVSIYVFLNNTFQNRRNNNVYEKEIIDLFQKKKTKALKNSVIFSIIVIITECIVILFNSSMTDWFSQVPWQIEKTLCFITFTSCITITIINVTKLGHFTYGVIDYENGLERLAKEERKNCRTQGYYENMNKGTFLNLVNNIEVLAERLIANHLHAKTSSAYDSNLKRAICDGITDAGEICTREEFAQDYQEIIAYRNLLLQDNELKDSDTVDRGDQINSLVGRFFQLYLKNELLTGISINNIEVKEANLTKASFRNSSLQSITFCGKTILKNADFRNSTINDVRFDEADCEGINFTDSKLIDVKLNTKMKLQRSLFTNSDLSNIGVIGPDDKEGVPIKFNHANFERANLTYLDIYNVCFDFANLSDVRLVDSKIGVSAQKQKNTSFQHADLTKADMLKCEMERCDFLNANLTNTILKYANISEIDFTESRLYEASLAESVINKCMFDKAYCTNLSLKGAKVTSSTFTYATMNSVDMSGATLEKVNFKDAVCRDTLWVRTNISDSDFERCVFAESRIVGETEKKTRIQQCNFTYVNFSNSAITNIEFINCDFEGADFSNVRLINVRFIDCKNLETALTTDVWLSKVDYLGKAKSELKKPSNGWRYPP